jgi:hypothetical protein
MKVDEIILEGPKWDKAVDWSKNNSAVNWVKNKAKMAATSLGNAVGAVGDRQYNTAKSKNEIDSWSKQVLGQWGKVEAGLQNSIGDLTKNDGQTPGNEQQYADQLSTWLKTYFRLSNTDLTNYNVATDGEFNDDNILKYIKKAYSIRLSPDYLEKVSGTQPQSTNTPNKKIPTNQNQTTELEPGTTKTQMALGSGETIEYSLMWVGPDGRVVTDPSKIKEINYYTNK